MIDLSWSSCCINYRSFLVTATASGGNESGKETKY
ncbi:hypothetical protein V6Z12_D08G172800 [Gossypium hirsutum]